MTIDLIVNFIIISTLFITFGLMSVIEGMKALRKYWDDKSKLDKELTKVKRSLWINVFVFIGLVMLHLFIADVPIW
ncbi:hypothetical protein N1M2_140 [Klebsiella phage N1M2]|uniref:Uncharacterized protein n=1 Tax=Klebsiella phage N1M2 TaxID=2664939 RepID=A0A6B7ZER4_9CAUD|nr:hypothetical protein PQB72_gp140 [Klebsiella phage N1M2]QGH72003.1 hypothetical protein N1M2_140 [Klebsiella phage N1M2]